MAIATKGAGGKQGDATFAGITLSNPGKVYYPDIGVTKLDVARYYETVAPLMLPYVAKRPISLVRCPDGIDGQRFFQRHAMKGMSKAIKDIPIPGGESKKKYLYIDDEAGLFGLVQIGVLEIHDWGVKLPKVTEPDHIVFDLDPDEDLDFAILKAAAVEVRDFLGELGFTTFLKVTGGKGLHVVAPLTPKLGWDEVKGFAKGVADALVTARPDRYTANMAKKVRDPEDLRRLSAQPAWRHGDLQLLDPRAAGSDGGLPAALGRAKGTEDGIPLYRAHAAGAAQDIEGRPMGGLFIHPPVDHGEGQEGAWARLVARAALRPLKALFPVALKQSAA